MIITGISLATGNCGCTCVSRYSGIMGAFSIILLTN